MKKSLSIILIALVTVAICMTTVYATTSFVIGLSASSTKVEKGSEVEVAVSLKNFTAGETGINVIHVELDYDKTVFDELESSDITTLSGWGAPTFNAKNGQMVMSASSFKAEDHEMVKIKFKVKESATVGNTVVSVKNVEASDAVNEIYPSDQKITLTIAEKEVTPTPTPAPVVNNTTPVVENKAVENPSTGVEDFTVPAILAISIMGVIAYVRYRKLDK